MNNEEKTEIIESRFKELYDLGYLVSMKQKSLIVIEIGDYFIHYYPVPEWYSAPKEIGEGHGHDKLLKILEGIKKATLSDSF